MKAVRCGIHGFHEVLGIDVYEIRFCWVLESDDEHAVQIAYRVALAISEPALKPGGIVGRGRSLGFTESFRRCPEVHCLQACEQ
ncbi:hypothetical protein V1507DRAFT_53311 [Lipomyces tetrasporus]